MLAHYRLIISPSSGSGRGQSLVPELNRTIAAVGATAEAHVTTSLDHGRRLAREGAEQGYRLVAVGGDGLVSAVCGAVAEVGNSNAAVAVVPAGRGNVFARHLGLVTRADALRALAHGTPTPIDLGRCNGTFFTTIVGVGIDGEVLELSKRVRLVSGKAVYAYSAVRALTSWRHARFSLALEGSDAGAQQTVTGFNVVVANAQYYGGGMRMAPYASVQDGCLDVVCLTAMSKFTLLANMAKVFKGTHDSVPAVKMWKATSVTIETDRVMGVYGDGELLATTPVTIDVVPNAVRILLMGPEAPATKEADR